MTCDPLHLVHFVVPLPEPMIIDVYEMNLPL